uniref:CHAT domain-containing protein n=1 Tax=Steinernema glaseri TaxID=37863 RepID=A0A1I7XXW7_9BILA
MQVVGMEKTSRVVVRSTMRSIFGLLAALLLLLDSSLASISYEKVVACGIIQRSPILMEREFFGSDLLERPQASAWSTDDSKFIDVQSYHAQDQYFGHVRYFSLHDCGFESVGQLCRSSFDNVSYGVELNETKTFPVRRNPRENATNEETFEAKLFKCQGRFLSKSEWMKKAEYECGASPTHYSLGGQCGDQDKYLEIVFVCDQPKIKAVFEAGKEFLEGREDYFHKSQFATLRRLAEISEKLLEAHARNDTESYEKYSWEFKKVSSTVPDIVNDAHAVAHVISVEHKARKPSPDDPTHYESRERMFTYSKYYVRHIGIERSMELFHLALLLISNGSLDRKLGTGNPFSKTTIYTYRPLNRILSDGDFGKYDAENLYKDLPFSYNDLYKNLPKRLHFPELKERLVDYYVEYMRSHTLGIALEHLDFLKEPNAHARLAAMYEEIFKPGLINT